VAAPGRRVLDDPRFCETSSEVATPADEAIRATAEWVKARVVKEAA